MDFAEDYDLYLHPYTTRIRQGRLLQTAVNNTTIESPEEAEEDVFVELYRSMVFLLALYMSGDIFCGKLIKIVPPLVGQIGMGIMLGPHGLDWLGIHTTRCWPLLGELGLVLMLCQAGLEMDLEVLQAVGPRGACMALVGSLLPSSIGFLLARFALELPTDAALAVGCSFGPTSAGIALNVLQQCGGILKTPLGQLIVAIAIVDDIIALVVLSQLQALTGTGEGDSISATVIVIPIVSALLWLFLGGAIALYVMPRILQTSASVEECVMTLSCPSKKESKGSSNNITTDNNEEEYSQSTLPPSIHLAHIIVLLFALLPATYYSQASHLLGAFLAGLSVCQQPASARIFNHELGKIVAWLMRIFFGASIAFRIPVELFADAQVLGTGFLLSLSLLGKIATGPLLTPVVLVADDDMDNIVDMTVTATPVTATRRCYDRQHVRDCLVVGFSMAGEAEFAMLVAAFAFTEGLVEEDVYASTVFAILLSTILSPCLLRLTLALLPIDSPPSDMPPQLETHDSVDGGQEESEVDDSDKRYSSTVNDVPIIKENPVIEREGKEGFEVHGSPGQP